jgi:hypothetical protein
MAKKSKSKSRQPARSTAASRKALLRADDKRWAADKKFERKMHDFLDAWRSHLREELKLHQELLKAKDKKRLDAHVKKAAKHHSTFVKKLNKL